MPGQHGVSWLPWAHCRTNLETTLPRDEAQLIGTDGLGGRERLGLVGRDQNVPGRQWWGSRTQRPKWTFPQREEQRFFSRKLFLKKQLGAKLRDDEIVISLGQGLRVAKRH